MSGCRRLAGRSGHGCCLHEFAHPTLAAGRRDRLAHHGLALADVTLEREARFLEHGPCALAVVDARQFNWAAKLAPRDRRVAVEDESGLGEASATSLCLNIGPSYSLLTVHSVSPWKYEQ